MSTATGPGVRRMIADEESVCEGGWVTENPQERVETVSELKSQHIRGDMVKAADPDQIVADFSKAAEARVLFLVRQLQEKLKSEKQDSARFFSLPSTTGRP